MNQESVNCYKRIDDYHNCSKEVYIFCDVCGNPCCAEHCVLMDPRAGQGGSAIYICWSCE